MNYQAQLNPWVVYRLLSDLQREAIARFRTRNDAESYLKVMEQIQSHVSYTLVFDGMKQQPSPEIKPIASKATASKTKRRTKPANDSVAAIA